MNKEINLLLPPLNPNSLQSLQDLNLQENITIFNQFLTNLENQINLNNSNNNYWDLNSFIKEIKALEDQTKAQILSFNKSLGQITELNNLLLAIKDTLSQARLSSTKQLSKTKDLLKDNFLKEYVALIDEFKQHYPLILDSNLNEVLDNLVASLGFYKKAYYEYNSQHLNNLQALNSYLNFFSNIITSLNLSPLNTGLIPVKIDFNKPQTPINHLGVYYPLNAINEVLECEKIRVEALNEELNIKSKEAESTFVSSAPINSQSQIQPELLSKEPLAEVYTKEFGDKMAVLAKINQLIDKNSNNSSFLEKLLLWLENFKE